MTKKHIDSDNAGGAPLAVRLRVSSTRAVRYGLFALGFLALACIAVFICVWLYHALYVENPHFLVREISVNETIHFNRRKVQTLLEEFEGPAHCRTAETNILKLDIREIRNKLLKNPLLDTVEVRKVMPGTISITLKERIPIAFVCANQTTNAVVDADGIVFPIVAPQTFRVDIPYITNVRDAEKLPMGLKTEDRGLAAAVNLVNILNSRPRVKSAEFEPRVILVDYQLERFDCRLKPLPDNKVFAADALVRIPWDNDKIPGALDRLDTILIHKIKTSGTLSFADVTLERNVNTRD